MPRASASQFPLTRGSFRSAGNSISSHQIGRWDRPHVLESYVRVASYRCPEIYKPNEMLGG